jgi:hypothetical protein
MISPSDAKPVRVLDADVYDALQLSAMIYGGIGCPFDTGEFEYRCPCCLVGHINFLCGDQKEEDEIFARTSGLALTSFESDSAVEAVLVRKGVVGEKEEAWDKPYPRISFPEWCAELGVVRGPHPKGDA